ncbi:MAG TPA: hypothetical protein VK821_00535, partial [Dehalococcoidia bacterium]|nr:hypothetical protein [Dehalococcoidia bacterium]
GRFAQPAVAQVKLCTVDAECPENERCASGLCVGALTDAGPLPDWAVGEAVSVGTAQCCELCSRKIDGCTVACSKAPDRANCYTGCYTRYKNCVSACSGACR